MNNIDILAIGDIATDVFIKIKDAETKCDEDNERCKLCFAYGDKIPYEFAEVCPATGNSSNVAICLSRLGVNSALLSNVGGDQYGVDCLNKLQSEKVNTSYIKKEEGKPTNYHYVLWYKKERTILTKHEEYNYDWVKEEQNIPSWIYLSSLGDNSASLHSKMMEYLEKNKNIKLAFQPGTFQIKLGKEKLKDIYSRTDVLICNYEEAKKILETDEEDFIILLKNLRNLGPKTVVITNSINGSYSYDGSDVLFMKAVDHIKTVENTGAGDSFSGSFVGALFVGKSISDAMVWGAVNAMSVVTQVGPHKGLLTRNQIEEYTKTMSEDYKPIKIN
jgi:2-dehydro-3-deoxygluconokinase